MLSYHFYSMLTGHNMAGRLCSEEQLSHWILISKAYHYFFPHFIQNGRGGLKRELKGEPWFRKSSSIVWNEWSQRPFCFLSVHLSSRFRRPRQNHFNISVFAFSAVCQMVFANCKCSQVSKSSILVTFYKLDCYNFDIFTQWRLQTYQWNVTR